ncbi:HD domain-containing protein [Flavobacterium silvaticum]|uniref:HD domain-containing protein n=1 Tax=Flavobacterium silvaticum TaxID=1852020 RepID=A0A972FIL4_9FLAO|nr:HD domain-containing protein [Flavobacterium silvaticum]NMH26641.1 HD domain-containing protein [Flavobacterium silvaticum]
MPDKPEHTFILDKLRTELPPYLHYHRVEHTLDVYECSKHIAQQENVNEKDTRLLLTAAIYHDSGYLYQIDEHESCSCDIARESLVKFGYSQDDIEIICGLIMATRIPQTPKTPLEKIICDADLDYLGRSDFYELGDRLFLEMQHLGTIENREEWDKLQVYFLSNHRFLTETSKKTRQPVQDAHLQQILTKIN